MPNPPQRIVIKETAYWQSRGTDPRSVLGSFVRLVDSDEAVYSRPRIKVKGEWQPLDAGWLERVAAVVLENLPDARKTIPTPEEATTAKSRILEVGVLVGETVGPFCHVPVGESIRLSPPAGDVKDFRLRCLVGETSVNLTAFPGGD